MLVATINEPSKDSCSVWNTGSPHERKIFHNKYRQGLDLEDFGWRSSQNFFGGLGIQLIAFDLEAKRMIWMNLPCHTYLDLDVGEDALFPIHELVFSKDSSTVAVISRSYNEVQLFSI